jgi:hypothetical protein
MQGVEMNQKVLWIRRFVLFGLLTVLLSPVLWAATRQGRASVRQLSHDIRRSRGSSVVSNVRLHPKDDTIVIVTANSGWNRLTPQQKQELGRKWLSRWIVLRKRFGSDVVVDIKTRDGYPLAHCYGNTRESGQCR